MKAHKLICLCLSLLTLASCSGVSSSSTSNETLSNSSNTELLNTKAIVVYFSATSHTKNVATTISDYINSPIYELEPVNEYTSSDLNYSNQNSRVVLEHNDPSRHVELVTTSFEHFSEATYIFLGAPVWWQELSWVVDDFVKNNDFSSKTIIPFATSASSGFSTTKLQGYTTNATWLEPQRFSSSASTSTITSWIDNLGIDVK